MPNEKEQGHKAEAPTKGKECGVCKGKGFLIDGTIIPGRLGPSMRQYPCPSCQPTEPQAKEDEFEKLLREYGRAFNGSRMADFEDARSSVSAFIRSLLSRSHAQGKEEAEHANYDTMVQHINNAEQHGFERGVRASLEKVRESFQGGSRDNWNVPVVYEGILIAAISALLTQGKE